MTELEQAMRTIAAAGQEVTVYVSPRGIMLTTRTSPSINIDLTAVIERIASEAAEKMIRTVLRESSEKGQSDG